MKFFKFNRVFKENIKNQYTKYRLPSFKNEYYLIKWYPNIQTEFHGHNGKNCNFTLLWGSYLFEERCKNKNSEITFHKIIPLKIYNINDKIGIHKIINSENKIKWSFHKYY